MANVYRQGDVLLVEIENLPPGRKAAREGGRLILARGEAGGHAYAILDEAAEVTETTGGRYLRVLAPGGVDLVHEEHDPIRVPRGAYRVELQREYAPPAIDRVVPQRELRNQVARVLREVARGARLRVTVRGAPVADLVPVSEAATFAKRTDVERLIMESPMDRALLDDLEETVGATVEDL
ncbi:MAG: type II toxin-antitoxin system prevent-host-death family antitoxin [Actinomycetota bacterium]